jgi:hypothetical protein
MSAIILAAIIVIAIIALLFVINARLNRGNPELEDLWWTGGPST